MSDQSAVHATMEKDVNNLNKIDTQLEKMRDQKSKLEAQQQENEQVQQELGFLKPGDRVFKLVGPVLVPKEVEDSKANVATRLEFITAEVKRYETGIAEQEKEREAIISRLQALQAKLQKGAASAKKA